ncbi:hypothetical protein BT96DRAFT_1006120 [Gymnopus androsaceus JB14]|uniref:Uncharacterized protein n=1 Tax=Gymnopus androsaceus JB14 TaxID=1447944 RepID=A0A6A4GLS7_9AGAR|nr:hypothetical protein BT96DRAFT_1006120 [Gymnopus androsaceus JB14]
MSNKPRTPRKSPTLAMESPANTGLSSEQPGLIANHLSAPQSPNNLANYVPGLMNADPESPVSHMQISHSFIKTTTSSQSSLVSSNPLGPEETTPKRSQLMMTPESSPVASRLDVHNRTKQVFSLLALNSSTDHCAPDSNPPSTPRMIISSNAMDSLIQTIPPRKTQTHSPSPDEQHTSCSWLSSPFVAKSSSTTMPATPRASTMPPPVSTGVVSSKTGAPVNVVAHLEEAQHHHSLAHHHQDPPPPTEKELRKRKRLDAFRAQDQNSNLDSTISRLYPIEIKGKGCILLKVPTDPNESLGLNINFNSSTSPSPTKHRKKSDLPTAKERRAAAAAALLKESADRKNFGQLTNQEYLPRHLSRVYAFGSRSSCSALTYPSARLARSSPPADGVSYTETTQPYAGHNVQIVVQLARTSFMITNSHWNIILWLTLEQWHGDSAKQ